MVKDSIVITGAARTPIGNFQGYYKNTPTPELGAAAIKAAIERSHIPVTAVEEVLMGCVLPAGLGQAPARQAALAAGVPASTGCTTLNKMCGSGMKAVMLGHDALIAHTQNIIVAGGMENMSLAPYLLPKARAGYRMGHQIALDHMLYDGLEDAYEKGAHMGIFAEQCAKTYGFSREAQDAFAIQSIKRAQAASQNGSFTAEITPMLLQAKEGEITITQDEGLLNIRLEKIPHLKPAFQKDGTITAANASSISDGAAALTLMRLSTAEKLQIKPLARVVGHTTYSQAPHLFTTAPIGAIQKLLAQLQWDVESVDLFEINEAFAAVPMAAIHDLKLDPAKVNVNGGGCILGHPIGASGARVLVTLIYALRERGLKRGVAALCIGGGEATAVAVEV